MMQLANSIFHAIGGAGDLRDIDAILLFKEEFASDLNRLMIFNVSQYADLKLPGLQINDQTYAQLLFGEENPLIDRTVSQMLALKWLLEGSRYKINQYCFKLPDVDWLYLQTYCKTTLKSPSDISLLLVLIISISLGKYDLLPAPSTHANPAKPSLPSEAIVCNAVKNGQIQCVQYLQEYQKGEVLECLRLTLSCNLHQLAVAELVPGNLATFESLNDESVLKAFGICFVLSVIQGILSSKADLLLDELLTIQRQIADLFVSRTSIRQAYDNILQRRADVLETKGFRCLSVNSPDERALLRLVVMSQPVTRSRAEWVSRAFYQLSDQSRTALVKGLNVDGDRDEIAVVPLGMHILFEEALRNTNGSVPSLVKALESLMEFLVRIFESMEPTPGTSGIIARISVEFARETVRGNEFKKDPTILDALKIPLQALLDAALHTPDHDPLAPQGSQITLETPAEPLLGSSRPSAPATNPVGTIDVKTCRACSDHFTYEHSDGDVKIICGVPGQVNYKAISYVWGNVTQVPVQCRGCSAVSNIPMENAIKFNRLMDLVGANSTVWLDAMSINQQDHRDIQAQVAVMGDIFNKADCVCVLLPSSDTAAFWLIQNLIHYAEFIRNGRSLFRQGSGGEAEEELGVICQRFYASLSAISHGQTQWVYWQRAWTFQELALAADLEIWCENLSSEPKLTNVKEKILTTALFLAKYKLEAHQYASVDIGFSRGYVPEYLTLVKRVFPREDLFLSDQEIDPEKHFIQTLFPHGQVEQVLGIRRARQRPGSYGRLSLMLDAFGSNERQARHEADLVCCWASMCNLKYDYDKQDSRAVALQKVLAAIRRNGIEIFNFHINTEARLEVDLLFIDYAKVHRLCNTTHKGFLPHAPIFSGRTDTVFHLLHAVTQSDEITPMTGNVVEMRPVVRFPSILCVDLHNETDVVIQFADVIQGPRSDGIGIVYDDILLHIMAALEGIPRSQLDKHVLVIVAIPVTSMLPMNDEGAAEQQYIGAWAVCPRKVYSPSLKVAREALNGTLVLAAEKKEANGTLEAVAYLTITHAQCGTYLLVADDAGEIKIDFVPLYRSDVIGNLFDRGKMHVRIDFEEE